MAELDKRQTGDGADDYGQAAQQMIKAVKQIGDEAGKQAAAKGVEAVANTAAATVQASVEGGTAAAEIAAGTAAGGPWGAILSAAWALRHTLYKILICMCLFFLIIIILIVSLPSVVMNSVFGLDGNVDMENPTTIMEAYTGLSSGIAAVVEDGYEKALKRINQIIADGNYDVDLSMDAIINNAQGAVGYDVIYILAAYSVSLEQQNTSKDDMVSKLSKVTERMYPVTYEEKEIERVVPMVYTTYREVTVTVVTSQTQIGTINGVPQYRYSTATKTYYEPDGTSTTTEPVTKAAFIPVGISVPTYDGGVITGTHSVTYYQQSGVETLAPSTENVKYAECTIHPFDSRIVIDAFGFDPDALYGQFNVSCKVAIQNMANALRLTLYGNNAPPNGFFPSGGIRRGNPAVVEIAKMQVGNVNGDNYWRWYGFNDWVNWCACFVSWCYAQAGVNEPRFSGCTSGGMGWFQSHGQWADRYYTDIAPGDAIFFDWDLSGDADHVGIVIGTDGQNVYTIEGNSGNACEYNSYPLGCDVIRGYGLMVW